MKIKLKRYPLDHSVIVYLSKFDIMHTITIALLLLCVVILPIVFFNSAVHYLLPLVFIIILALIFMTYKGHVSRKECPVFLGRSLKTTKEIELRNYILENYSGTLPDKKLGSKDFAKLTVALYHVGWITPGTSLKFKVQCNSSI